MFMQEEEILARCETCGFISQQSNVLKHMREQHSFDESGNDISESDININNVIQENSVEEPVEKVIWKRPDVLLLLDLYQQFENKFHDKKTTHRTVWRMIAEKMKEKNRTFSSENCENKFKNLKKTYKKISDSNKMTGQGASNWPFFQEMDNLLRKNPEISPLSTASSLEGISNNMENDISQPTCSYSQKNESTIKKTQKRKINDENEPVWFKEYRKECQKRHEDKMNRQDRLISVLEKLTKKSD